jgi:hypothetical protein
MNSFGMIRVVGSHAAHCWTMMHRGFARFAVERDFARPRFASGVGRRRAG